MIPFSFALTEVHRRKFAISFDFFGCLQSTNSLRVGVKDSSPRNVLISLMVCVFDFNVLILN